MALTQAAACALDKLSCGLDKLMHVAPALPVGTSMTARKERRYGEHRSVRRMNRERAYLQRDAHERTGPVSEGHRS